MGTVAPDRTLRAGCAPALPAQKLLTFLHALREREAGLAIDVTHAFSAEQLDLVRGGELDLAIVFDPADDPELEIVPLYEGDELAACLPADHPLVTRSSLGPEDLAGETFLCAGRATNPHAFDRALERYAAVGYRLESLESANGNSGRDVLVAVAAGRGIALLPPSLEELREARHGVVLRPLDPPLRTPPSAAVWLVDAPVELRPVFESVRAIAQELRDAADGDDTNGVLTARQRDVLRLLADGRSTREIADELVVTETTVRNYIARLMSALGVHTRLQAVLVARRRGLLDL